MTEQAARLESLLKETVLLESTVTAAGREREQITPRRLAQDFRANLKARVAELSDAATKLRGIEPETISGRDLLRDSAEAGRLLAEIRSRDQRGTSIRESLSRLAVSLGREHLRNGEGFAAGLERLEP